MRTGPMLDGKVVVVTGAAQGIGRRHAERCVEAGARVVLTDRQAELGNDAAAAIGADHARFATHDVTSPDSWQSVVDTAIGAFGRIDGLINNAGLCNGLVPIEDETLEMFQSVLQVNLVGTWLGVKSVIAPMRSGGGGSIVNVSSVHGMKGTAGFGSYSSTKWAIRGLTRTAARELGPHGIRVNSLHPAATTGTGMFPTPEPGADLSRFATLPLPRPGTPDDVASLAMFLLSDDASYITGVEHIVDGGTVA